MAISLPPERLRQLLPEVGGRYYWKSRDVDDLSPALVDDLCARAAERPSALSTIDVWHNGGAISQVAADATAFGRRDAPFSITFAANWTDAADDERNIAWSRAGWAATEQFSSGGVYLNFPGLGEEQEDLVRAGYGTNYARLTALKAEYDPTNLFRMNQNIRPAGSS